MNCLRFCHPLTCNLYLTKQRSKGPYYRAMVFADVMEMRYFAHEQSKLIRGQKDATRRWSYWKHTKGFARHFGRVPDERFPNRVGCVLLASEYLTNEIVSHEMTHAAAFHVLGGMRIRMTNGLHEELALAQGSLLGQFCRHLARWRERKWIR